MSSSSRRPPHRTTSMPHRRGCNHLAAASTWLPGPLAPRRPAHHGHHLPPHPVLPPEEPQPRHIVPVGRIRLAPAAAAAGPAPSAAEPRRAAPTRSRHHAEPRPQTQLVYEITVWFVLVTKRFTDL